MVSYLVFGCCIAYYIIIIVQSSFCEIRIETKQKFTNIEFLLFLIFFEFSKPLQQWGDDWTLAHE